uniref:Uncharacterized protein n=1 Tax=Arundo donax TaxID=35708 RepID=A0A0A9EV12_ARUDO
MMREVDARAGEAEAEREGEAERFHQRIGAYGQSETLVIM